MNNICPKCGKVIFEELYAGTISPELCYCEAERVWHGEAVETHYHRGPVDRYGSTITPPAVTRISHES